MEKNHFKSISFITLTGFFINIFLVLIKSWAGFSGHSEALMADAIHSASDAITDIAVIIGAAIWTKPPDEDHPYGHHRMETMVTIFIGIVLLFAAAGIGIEAASKLFLDQRPEPLPLAAYVAALSIFIKEALYRWTIKKGEGLKSSTLVANAWHHRLDALSSIPAFLAVSISIIFDKLLFIDSIGAIIVSVFIAQAALKIMWPNLQELMAKGATPETCRLIVEEARRHPQVLDAGQIRTRFMGTRIFADIHLVVDGNLSVFQAHKISEEVRFTLMQKKANLEDVVIHIRPPNPDDSLYKTLNKKEAPYE